MEENGLDRMEGKFTEKRILRELESRALESSSMWMWKSSRMVLECWRE